MLRITCSIQLLNKRGGEFKYYLMLYINVNLLYKTTIFYFLWIKTFDYTYISHILIQRTESFNEKGKFYEQKSELIKY
ncbi:hypothetical protein C923_05084 [Plasmodium falciparum UGT5.1]|uniref:Uncharacterized protein n=1 Tax=Plasmodium falciparum UGT5.1 TaxID=1237627 RepID=W7JHK3_PLAFA|nr:hypothetical protein C923_05084 [Plasmodium falciparum UGT5.1]